MGTTTSSIGSITSGRTVVGSTPSARIILRGAVSKLQKPDGERSGRRLRRVPGGDRAWRPAGAQLGEVVGRAWQRWREAAGESPCRVRPGRAGPIAAVSVPIVRLRLCGYRAAVGYGLHRVAGI